MVPSDVVQAPCLRKDRLVGPPSWLIHVAAVDVGHQLGAPVGCGSAQVLGASPCGLGSSARSLQEQVSRRQAAEAARAVRGSAWGWTQCLFYYILWLKAGTGDAWPHSNTNDVSLTQERSDFIRRPIL